MKVLHDNAAPNRHAPPCSAPQEPTPQQTPLTKAEMARTAGTVVLGALVVAGIYRAVTWVKVWVEWPWGDLLIVCLGGTCLLCVLGDLFIVCLGGTCLLCVARVHTCIRPLQAAIDCRMAAIDAEVEESRARFRARVMAVLCEDLDDEDELKVHAQREYAAYVEADQAVEHRCVNAFRDNCMRVSIPHTFHPARTMRHPKGRMTQLPRLRWRLPLIVKWMSAPQQWLGGWHWPPRWMGARCQTHRLLSEISTGDEDQ